MRGARAGVGVAALLVAGLMLGGCGAGRWLTTQQADSVSPKSKRQVSADSMVTLDDSGHISVTFEPPEKDGSDLPSLVKDVRADASIEDSIAALDEVLAMPEDIDITFGPGLEGPQYDPETRTIEFPYEFIGEIYTTFDDAEYADNDEDLTASTSEAALFIVFHELAHALIDVDELTVVGKEEDAADALGVVMAVELVDDGVMAVSAADLFGASAVDPSETELVDYMDSHSMDLQRFYTIRCLVYGADTKQFADAVESVDLDEDRQLGCAEEYDLAADSWLRLLEPFVVEEEDA